MPPFTTDHIPDLSGQTVIITGANSGIGRAAAQALATAGARVVLAVRDQAKGEAAAANIPGTTEVRPLDLARLDSVRAFAADWQGDIDLLINNAGVMIPPLSRTVDGFELQFGTNHLGHFALTNLLLPQVTGRVVTVSSDAHRGGAIDFDDLNWERKRYRPWRAYGQSKLANLLFTSELQRRLTASRVAGEGDRRAPRLRRDQSPVAQRQPADGVRDGADRQPADRPGRRRRRAAHPLRGGRGHPRRQLRRPVRPLRPRPAGRAHAGRPLRRRQRRRRPPAACGPSRRS